MINEIAAFFNSGFEETATVAGAGYSKSVSSIWDTEAQYSGDGLGVNSRQTTVHVKESDFTGITIKPKDTVVRGSVTWYVQEVTNNNDGVIQLSVSKTSGR